MSIRIGRLEISDTYTISNTDAPEEGEIEFSRQDFIEFLQAVKRGDLDPPEDGQQEAP